MSAEEQGRPRRAAGNMALAVLVDRSRPEYALVPETLIWALNHLGMPYQLLDVGAEPVSLDQLSPHSAVVIAQEGLGASLSPVDVSVLLRAVQEGLGLVNFDSDLEAYGEAYLTALGLEGGWPGRRLGFESAEAIVVSESDDYITYLHENGRSHAFRAPLPVCAVRAAGSQAKVLAVSPVGMPALVSTRIGVGRAVQWTLWPRVWLRQYLGHARGLDDLFWRSIVWAARKPFAMNAMPPFVRLRFDDCFGHWQTPADMSFVDLLNEFGHVPGLYVCMRAVGDEAAARMRVLADAGKAEFGPHTLAPNVGIFYGDSSGEYSTEQFRSLMAEVDQTFARWRIRYSRVLSDHNHETSARAMPFLLERGIVYKMNVTVPGETWERPHRNWRPAPYASMHYVLDRLPDNPEFFVAFNHHPPFLCTQATMPDGRFLFSRPGGIGEDKWDFLNGLTVRSHPERRNDVTQMARRFTEFVRLGLGSRFFGGGISHSHFTRDLSPGEWQELLERAERQTARYEKIYRSYEQIAEYARSRADTRLALADCVHRAGVLRLGFEGQSTVSLEPTVFESEDDIQERRLKVGAFTGGMQMEEAVRATPMGDH